jgi:hypothetical protein
VDYMLVPKGDIQQWETQSRTCLDALYESATTSSYWDSLKVHYAEENQSDTVNWDNVSFVKSICGWRASGGFRLMRSNHSSPNARRRTLEVLGANCCQVAGG